MWIAGIAVASFVSPYDVPSWGGQSARRAKVGAVDARLSPDGGFLYVDESAAATVGAFTVSGGSLTELGTFPLPAGAAPAGIVVS